MRTYLDHNATTPLDERVLEQMLPFLKAQFGNPSAVYREGRLARQAVEAAREQVAALVKAAPGQVIFTSGGTEANNLAIKGAAARSAVALSAVEHASVRAPALEVSPAGRPIWVEVDGDGRVTEETLRQALAQRPRLVSVMLANNESGVIQDVARFAAIAREQGALFHTDAVQAAGKIEVDFVALGVHLMSLSSHKIYGPKGIGALLVDKGVELRPQQVGGGQEDGLRSGTENVAAIVGFGKAAELAAAELGRRQARSEMLRQLLLQGLVQMGEVKLFAAQAPSLPNTVYLALPGIDGEALVMEMDRAGISVASGSACDSRKPATSEVLRAMGVDEHLARGALRVSLGKDNTEHDIERFLQVLRQQMNTLRNDAMLAWA